MKQRVKFCEWIGLLVVFVAIPLFLIFGLFIPDAWWQFVFHAR